MLALLHDQGVLKSLPIAAVLGGEGAIANGIDPQDVATLRASAALRRGATVRGPSTRPRPTRSRRTDAVAAPTRRAAWR